MEKNNNNNKRDSSAQRNDINQEDWLAFQRSLMLGSGVYPPPERTPSSTGTPSSLSHLFSLPPVVGNAQDPTLTQIPSFTGNFQRQQDDAFRNFFGVPHPSQGYGGPIGYPPMHHPYYGLQAPPPMSPPFFGTYPMTPIPYQSTNNNVEGVLTEKGSYVSSEQNSYYELPQVTSRSNQESKPEVEPRFPSNPRFVLMEQPNEKQRKSYRNENRCILPNPLMISERTSNQDTLPKIENGTVLAKLVDKDGKTLPPPKDNVLECLDGSLLVELSKNKTAHFSLKVLDTSDGEVFRLLFIVNYETDEGPWQERILSRPFVVQSNRRKSNKTRIKPSVIGIKPNSGPSSEETEIWIKGKNFVEKVGVDFGDEHGKILEVQDNIITVLSPTRPELTQDTTVPVKVFNKFGMEHLVADNVPQFTYTVDNSMITTAIVEDGIHQN